MTELKSSVYLNGERVANQADGIQAFKDACLASQKTPPMQEGTWTLTAPDGRTWKAEHPLKCVSMERRERVPESVALARIMTELRRTQAEDSGPNG